MLSISERLIGLAELPLENEQKAVRQLAKKWGEKKLSPEKCQAEIEKIGVRVAKTNNLLFLQNAANFGITDVKKLQSLYTKPVHILTVGDHCSYPPMLEAIAAIYIKEMGYEKALAVLRIVDQPLREKIAEEAKGKAPPLVIRFFLNA